MFNKKRIKRLEWMIELLGIQLDKDRRTIISLERKLDMLIDELGYEMKHISAHLVKKTPPDA